jgi:hypothetical protein
MWYLISVTTSHMRVSHGRLSYGRVMDMHLTGVHLTGMHLMGMYLMGMCLKERSWCSFRGEIKHQRRHPLPWGAMISKGRCDV